MDGNTLPTLNSHNFKVVMCPTCKKYPSRHGRRLTPRIIFTGFRWNAEEHILEIQGHCDFCKWKCPNRNSPPCRAGGLPSMEAVGINVDKTVKNLNIEIEWPPTNFIYRFGLVCFK